MNPADLSLGPEFLQDARQLNLGLAAQLPDDLDMGPFPTTAKPMPKGLDDGFLCRETARERGIGIFLAQAVVGLGRSE